MKTSRGNAALPDRCRLLFVKAAMKRALTFMAFFLPRLLFGVAQATGVNPDQSIRLNGMELFFGIVPALDRARPPARPRGTKRARRRSAQISGQIVVTSTTGAPDDTRA